MGQFWELGKWGPWYPVWFRKVRGKSYRPNSRRSRTGLASQTAGALQRGSFREGQMLFQWAWGQISRLQQLVRLLDNVREASWSGLRTGNISRNLDWWTNLRETEENISSPCELNLSLYAWAHVRIMVELTTKLSVREGQPRNSAVLMAGLPGLGATLLPSMKGFRAARRNRGCLHSYPALVVGGPGLNLQVKGIGGSNWEKVGEWRARK